MIHVNVHQIINVNVAKNNMKTFREVRFQKVTVKDKSGKSHTQTARIRPGDTHVAIQHYDAMPATNFSPAVKAHTDLSFGSIDKLDKVITHAKKKFGLKGLIVKPESDKDRLMKMKVKKLQKEFSEGKLVLEKTADDKQIKIDNISEIKDDVTMEDKRVLKQQVDKLVEEGKLNEEQVKKIEEDGILNMEK